MNSPYPHRQARGSFVLCWLCALVCALVLSGCRGEAGPLTDNQIPSIVLLEPQDGASFAPGSPIELRAEASDPDGSVSRVVFHVDDEEAASVSAPPYRHSFTPDAAGSYRLTARVYDDQGASSVPVSVTVRVLEPEMLFTLSVAVTGAGRVLSEPGGVNCPGSCQADFALGAPVALRAVSGDGVRFLDWGDACAAATLERCTVSLETSGHVDVSATFSGETPEPSAAPFAIVVLPDTQNFICSRCDNPHRIWEPEVFEAQTQWAVDNREARNIVFVTHVGDVLECANYGVSVSGLPCNTDGKDEWVAADRALSILDGRLPYSVAIGDHEYFPEQRHSADYSNYVRHFGASRYQAYDWYGGAGPRELSHYQLFEAGGYTFLHIALEWEAPDDALEWAQGVIGEHPGKPTIVTVHGYLSDGLYSGDRSCNERTCTPVPASDTRNYRPRVPDSYDCPGDACVANAPEDIFQVLIRPNPQVFMVLGGHYHGPGGIRFFLPPSNIGELHQVSRNDAGLPVFEMLANYQVYTKSQGFMRVITFRPGGGEGGQDCIFVETYSPHLNAYQRDDMGTRSASEFHFDLDFGTRFAAGGR